MDNKECKDVFTFLQEQMIFRYFLFSERNMHLLFSRSYMSLGVKDSCVSVNPTDSDLSVPTLQSFLP